MAFCLDFPELSEIETSSICSDLGQGHFCAFGVTDVRYYSFNGSNGFSRGRQTVCEQMI